MIDILPLGTRVFSTSTNGFYTTSARYASRPIQPFRITRSCKINMTRLSKYAHKFFLGQDPPLVKAPLKSPPLKRASLEKIQNLFIYYTKKSRRLLTKVPGLIISLVGGMAVKLFVGERASETTKHTSDFDLKFIVSKPLRTKAQVEEYTKIMHDIVRRHILGFMKFMTNLGYRYTPMTISKIKGVKRDYPVNGSTYPGDKKIYEVMRVTLNSKIFLDMSLSWIPGTRRNQFIIKNGFLLKKPYRLLYDSIDVLARSFIQRESKSRNPIYGSRKEKGIKNMWRIRNISETGRVRISTPVKRFMSAIVSHNTQRSTLLAKKILDTS